MSKNKKLPPSQIRYQKAHPTISCVLTSELKSILDQRRGSLSYGQFVKKILSEDNNSYLEGCEKGRVQCYEVFHKNSNCWVCGKPLSPSNSNQLVVYCHHECFKQLNNPETPGKKMLELFLALFKK